MQSVLEEDLKVVKDYLRVDFDDDDSLISGIINASREFLRGAIGDNIEKYITSRHPKYTMLLCLVCVDLYERRSFLTEKSLQKSPIVQSMIAQLQLEGD